jgi:hypothetical protein
MHTGFWWENQNELGHQENLDVDEKITFDLREIGWVGMAWLIWIKIWASGKLL